MELKVVSANQIEKRYIDVIVEKAFSLDSVCIKMASNEDTIKKIYC